MISKYHANFRILCIILHLFNGTKVVLKFVDCGTFETCFKQRSTLPTLKALPPKTNTVFLKLGTNHPKQKDGGGADISEADRVAMEARIRVSLQCHAQRTIVCTARVIFLCFVQKYSDIVREKPIWQLGREQYR